MSNIETSNFIPEGFLLAPLPEVTKSVPKAPPGLTSPASSSKVWPKISIVMPTFNHAEYIERSLLSIINQAYPNIELIVIDGDSSDETPEIVRAYQKYISHLVSEADNGQSDALNKGFALASGDIYGWLNSDDLYLPGVFYTAARALSAAPQKQVVFGDWLSIGKHDEILDYNHAFDFSVNHFKYEGFHLNAQSMFWRSSVHKQFSGFDVSLHNTMDYQMILEFGLNAGQSKFLRLPMVFGAFRRYDGQKTGGMNARVLDEHKRIAAAYGYSDKYSTNGKLKRLFFRIRRSIWYMKRGGARLLWRRLSESFVAK